MSRYHYVEHAPKSVLHSVVFDSSPRITETVRVDVYDGDTLVTVYVHNAWHDANGRLVRYTTDEFDINGVAA